jgi:hypothetical protein
MKAVILEPRKPGSARLRAAQENVAGAYAARASAAASAGLGGDPSSPSSGNAGLRIH